MKTSKFNSTIVITLLSVSVISFLLQQLLFHDLHESGFLFFQDFIFLPIHIIIVTFIFEKILEIRSKREKMEQMNILIDAFFTEIGTDALRVLHPVINEREQVSSLLSMDQGWDEKDFSKASKQLDGFTFHASVDADSLQAIKDALMLDKTYLFQLFSNPSLLEHAAFTDMLWALYHLTDELEHRNDVGTLPTSDYEHLEGDIIRSYRGILNEWIVYMKHLKGKYPYLWSISVRKNPLQKDNDIIIRSV